LYSGSEGFAGNSGSKKRKIKIWGRKTTEEMNRILWLIRVSKALSPEEKKEGIGMSWAIDGIIEEILRERER